MEMWQLQQLQGLPLEVKIRKTQERIKEWYEFYNGQVYVSFSGGKDSTVLLDIARKMYPDIEAVFVDTGLEYPEIREFVKGFDNVTWLKPKMNFKEVVDKVGYPIISKRISRQLHDVKKLGENCWAWGCFSGRESGFYNMEKWKSIIDAPFKISDQCCNIMKKQPAKEYGKRTGKKAIIGTMADESQQREATWLKHGCNAFENKNPVSNPISFWKEQDIFRYIQLHDIPIASCYGEIIEGDQLEGQTVMYGCMSHLTTSKCKRTGCMWCMFGVHLEKEPNRFQMMKTTHPKQYDYCINKLGLDKVLDYINVKY